jgi:phytanoyl-CoA hydroxylase
MAFEPEWPKWLEQYDRDGFFVATGVLDARAVERIRGYIEDALADADAGGGDGARFDPEPVVRHGGGEALALRDRFRKIGQLGLHDAGVWNDWHCHPNVLAIMRRLLGDDVRLMFSSVFLKPARHGAATPWHQDIGLWRDKIDGAASIWCALDPATRENGCLQFVPGSYRYGEVEHVLYEGEVHKEIRRDLLAGLEPVHVELQPGDAVVWRAAMFHYSPPNPSPLNRVAVAGVYVNQQMVEALAPPSTLPLPWVVRAGAVCRR